MNVITHPAARSALYASPEGELLVPGTRAFCERIGYQNPDFDAGDYAVRNMGFVAIARNAPGRLKLRLRPGLVSGHALKAVCRHVADSPFGMIEIEYFDTEWKKEEVVDRSAVVCRLVELCTKPVPSEGLGRPIGSRFRVEALNLDSATEEYGNPLKPLLQKWRVSYGNFDDTLIPFLMRHALPLKLMIIAASHKGAPLRFQFISDEVKMFSDTVRASLIGQPIENQPDKEYGAWIQKDYSALVEANVPRFDRIEAAVKQNPAESRHITYERLLLPWRMSKNGVVVTTTSVILNATVETKANDNAAGPRGRRLSGLKIAT